jgi:fibro-slime domain-containing protein
MRISRLSCLVVPASVFLGSCGGSAGGERPNVGRGGSADSSGNGGTTIIASGSGGSTTGSLGVCNPADPKSSCYVDAPAPEGCGDGQLDKKHEACDDGNREAGDGCAANCLSVEPGFSCIPAGERCHPVARCGDGVVAPSEACDDGNTKDGDGCSQHCKLEIGYKCSDQPSQCTPTKCGDGKQEGAESCDDGNTMPFDGCSALCQKEPDCAQGACKSECGDGIVIGEDCDDGNRINGDGCSSDCKIEPGFECSQEANCEKMNDACILRVSALFRDFNGKNESGGHPDFQPDCQGEKAALGGVQAKLDGKGKPVLASGTTICAQSAESFAQWYTDSSYSVAIPGSIVLFDNGKGGFVNLYGDKGEKWYSWDKDSESWCNNDYTTCATDNDPTKGTKCEPDCHPCSYVDLEAAGQKPGCNGKKIEYDGNPFFFPLDNETKALKETRSEAQVPPIYGYDWKAERQVRPGAGTHNFHFTTEVNYWFQYDQSKSAQLDFTGDDDVWVFINGTLAVDLGGLHIPADGNVTVSKETASKYGLENGKVYKISVFHAERKTTCSSFQLTLQGFNTVPSLCTPRCGDGIVSAGEECDDGKNTGTGYGECGPGCVNTKLGYCGDNVVQAGEDCDDGNQVDGDECPSACRYIDIPK